MPDLVEYMRVSDTDEHNAVRNILKPYIPVCWNSILEHLSGLGCNKVVVENHSQKDLEWATAYDRFYGKLFAQYDRTSKRVHFFIEPDGAPRSAIHKQAKYLGYCSIRPVPKMKISETNLVPITGITNAPKEFCLTVCEVEEKVEGKRFKSRGMPFIEQDTVVGNCAQASIWMMTRYMANRFRGCRTASMYDITVLATKLERHGRIFPSSGLNGEQVSDALIELEYAPLAYVRSTPNDDWPHDPLDTIYKYIESEIPVFIGAKRRSGPGHAYVIVGHTIDRNIAAPHIPLEFYSSSHWVDNFLKHDDQEGPYKKISRKDLLSELEAIIVPVPGGVNLLGESAELLAKKVVAARAAGIIRDFYSDAPTDVKKAVERLLADSQSKMGQHHASGCSTVLRTYLKTRESYHGMFSESDMNPRVKALYNSRRFPIPDWIWVTEISNTRFIPFEHRMLGEIIVNATSVGDPEFCIAHIPNFVIGNLSRSRPDYVVEPIPNDGPYRHQMRIFSS